MSTTLIILSGPLAVGQKLCEKTGFKLFHNHMTIDALTPIFNYGSPAMRILVPEFRYRVMEEAVKNQFPGIVHTFVWNFQGHSDTEFMRKVKDMVSSHGGRTCFVELQAPPEARKERQLSENRKGKHKPGNVDRGVEGLVDFEKGHILDSKGIFPFPENYLRIDNTHISAEESAEKICQHFNLIILH